VLAELVSKATRPMLAPITASPKAELDERSPRISFSTPDLRHEAGQDLTRRLGGSRSFSVCQGWRSLRALKPTLRTVARRTSMRTGKACGSEVAK
jgi:hypothetical protein